MKKVIHFLITLISNLLVLIVCLGVVSTTQNESLKIIACLVLVIFFLIRSFYENLRKLYESAVNVTVVSCNTTAAMAAVDRLKRLDFLRLYRRKVFLLECQLCIDSGDKKKALSFLESNKSKSTSRHTDERMFYLSAALQYSFFYAPAETRKCYDSLVSFSESSRYTNLNASIKHLSAAYSYLSEGKKELCLKELAEVDPKQLSNRDKAYFNYVYVIVEDPDSSHRRRHIENASGFGKAIPLLSKRMKDIRVK